RRDGVPNAPLEAKVSRLEGGGDLSLQPGAGVGPITIGGSGGDAEEACCLFCGEAAEKAEVHQVGFYLILGGQTNQSILHGQKLIAGRLVGELKSVEIHTLRLAATFLSLLAPGAVD